MPDYRLILGDSAVAMGEIADASIDLIVTSPPYDDLRVYDGRKCFDFPAIAAHCHRVLKSGGVLVWVVGDQVTDGSETGTSFVHALYFNQIGFKLWDTMIYGKNNPIPHNHYGRYEPSFEYMFVLCKSKPKTWNPLKIPNPGAGRLKRTRSGPDPLRRCNNPGNFHITREYSPRPNIWFYNVEVNTNGHPAVFPIDLPNDHILSWSNRGDTILDPFSGSGQTGVAALQLGRNFIGIEISPEYYAIGERRMKQVAAQTSLYDLLDLEFSAPAEIDDEEWDI